MVSRANDRASDGTVAPTAIPIDSTSSTQAGGGAIGSLLVTPRAAVPLPNPNLAYSAAYPNQRGFVRAEPFFIYPFLAMGIGQNDNLTGTKTTESPAAW